MAERKPAVACFVLLFLLLNLTVGGWSLMLWTKTRFKKDLAFEHFWKSTGFSPVGGAESRGDFLLTNDEKLNLDFIGALPNQGIKTVRIHWILDLVTVSDAQSERPTFHLEKLDTLIDRLHRSGLYPWFELMGNPSNFFHDFKTQAGHWTALIEKIVEHYTNLYGADYVHGWRFELMNEPDLKQYNSFNLTLAEYIDYFRASEKAVASLAGPAGLFRDNKNHPLCWGLLNYCNSNPCNLSMITFHRKGGEVGSKVVEEGLDLINSLMSKFPYLKRVPFGNTEADIMKGWSKPREWRTDVRYAALAVQVIIGHIREMLVKRNIPLKVLSFDNAFLSFSPYYFQQRTLLARFQMNNTVPGHVQFFRKPVYSVMGLLSLLGYNLKDIHYNPGVQGFSYLMTSDKYQDTFLGVITGDRARNDTYIAGDETYVDVNVRIELGNSTLSGISVGYLMDNGGRNPHQVWVDGGRPDFPDGELRRKMREAEGFQRVFIKKVKPHQTRLGFLLRRALIPSVLAVSTCYNGTQEPGPVTDLRYENVTHDEVLLFWKDTSVKSRCILTYAVEFRQAGDNNFHRINKSDSIFLFHHHVAMAGSVAGEYRVAAVDYWNRHGAFSNAITVPR